MHKQLTRKEFLSNASKAAVGLTAVAGVSSLITTASTKAKPVISAWPWPYTELNADDVRIQAHYLYWNDKDCCSGVFGSLVNALAAALGDPWTGLPMEIMLFGRGGGVGWGNLCGTLNGGAALISLVTEKAASGPLITELWGWYTTEALPSVTANQFATSGQYLVHNYDDELPSNISGNPLCHVSVTDWCNVAGKKVSDVERKERCARISGDIAAKTVEILNAHFAGSFTPTYVDPPTVTDCLGCHGSAFMYNVMTKMECTQCHGDPHSPSDVHTINPGAHSFELSQNYPNPFNPSTKIRFSLPSSERVRLEVYDIRGSLVKTLIDSQEYQPGTYQVEWNGTDNLGRKVASGVYFTRIAAGKHTATRKMNLLK
ncbi:MAG: hypothetical protein Kow0098_23730 [Ignavibacteriaceae bacterium]